MIQALYALCVSGGRPLVIWALLPMAVLGSNVNALSGEPLGFKADKLGMNLSDFCIKYDRPYLGDPRHAPALQFGDVYATGINTVIGGAPENLRAFGLIIATKAAMFEHKSESFAGVSSDVKYHFFAVSLTDWDLLAKHNQQQAELIVKAASNGKHLPILHFPAWRDESPEVLAAASRLQLGEITIQFMQTNFDLVIAAMKEKYGEPLSVQTETFRNALGASTPYRHVRWVMGQDSIEALERAGELEISKVEIRRSSILARASVSLKVQAEASAKDL